MKQDSLITHTPRKKVIRLDDVAIAEKDRQAALDDIAHTYAFKLAQLLDKPYLVDLFEEALVDDVAVMEALGIRELFETKLTRFVNGEYIINPAASIKPRAFPSHPLIQK